MRLLAIDYGEKNVGIALSDRDGAMAFPHSVLKNDKNLLSRVESIIKNNDIGRVVIGDSRDYKGKQNPIMKKAHNFAGRLTAYGFIVVFEPELLSSRQAAQIQGQTAMLDASAASIILQSFIDRMNKS